MSIPEYLLPEHMQDKDKIQRIANQAIKEHFFDLDNLALANLALNSSYCQPYASQFESLREPGIIYSSHSENRRSAKMEYIEDELPPYNIAIRSMVEYLNKKESFCDFILGFCDVEFSTGMQRKPRTQHWINEKNLVAKLLREGYDYQNLYDPNCDTALYYFMEDIDLDFSSMTDDDEYYPFGWVNIFEHLEKLGIKLPNYEMREGRYNHSIQGT